MSWDPKKALVVYQPAIDFQARAAAWNCINQTMANLEEVAQELQTNQPTAQVIWEDRTITIVRTGSMNQHITRASIQQLSNLMTTLDKQVAAFTQGVSGFEEEFSREIST